MNLLQMFEALNTVLPYTIIKKSNEETTYSFEFNNVEFQLSIKYQRVADEILATIAFYEVDEDGNLNVDQTNKHSNALSLFATIIRIVKETETTWDNLIFVGETGSRVGLYTALIKRFSKYNNIGIKTSIGTLFVISKNQIPRETQRALAKMAEEYLSLKSI